MFHFTSEVLQPSTIYSVDRAVLLELHEHNNCYDLLQPIKLSMTSEGGRLYEPRYIFRTN